MLALLAARSRRNRFTQPNGAFYNALLAQAPTHLYKLYEATGNFGDSGSLPVALTPAPPTSRAQPSLCPTENAGCAYTYGGGIAAKTSANVIPSGSGKSCTIVAVVSCTAYSQNIICSQGQISGYGDPWTQFYIDTNAGGKNVVAFSTNYFSTPFVAPDATEFDDDTPCLVAATVDASATELRLYKNGAKIATFTSADGFSGTSTVTAGFTIGSGYGFGSTNWQPSHKQQLQAVTIYDKALSDSDHAALYTAYLGP